MPSHPDRVRRNYCYWVGLDSNNNIVTPHFNSIKELKEYLEIQEASERLTMYFYKDPVIFGYLNSGNFK